MHQSVVVEYITYFIKDLSKSCTGLYSQLAHQQEGGALYASVQNVDCGTNVKSLLLCIFIRVYEPSKAERGLPIKH